MIENRMLYPHKEKGIDPLDYAEWQRRRKDKFRLAECEFETIAEYFLLEEGEWLCLCCRKKATSVALSFGGILRLTCKECGHIEEGGTSICL